MSLLDLKRQVCDILLPHETIQQGIKRIGQTIKLCTTKVSLHSEQTLVSFLTVGYAPLRPGQRGG